MNHATTRRNFLLTGLTVLGTVTAATHSPPQPSLPERILGHTGVSVPIFGLGGAGRTPLSWSGKGKPARAIISRALQLGVRYFDTAASYGPSETYLGQVLPPYRKQIFLATKTAARTRDAAWRDLERSLTRLKTDYLDLWQLHHVSFLDELDQILSPDGAIQALEEAKAQKLIRWTGITGHHEPDVIAAGLRRYPFDTTLIPLNAADRHHPRPFSTNVLPVTREKQVGVIAMKVPAYGRLFQPGVLDGMEQALGYTLSLSGVHCSVIAAETVAQLESNVEVARSFQTLTPAEMKLIEQRTARAWKENTFFRQWT